MGLSGRTTKNRTFLRPLYGMDERGPIVKHILVESKEASITLAFNDMIFTFINQFRKLIYRYFCFTKNYCWKKELIFKTRKLHKVQKLFIKMRLLLTHTFKKWIINSLKNYQALFVQRLCSIYLSCTNL